MGQHWTQVERLFDELIEMDRAQRAAHLVRACPDAKVRAEVESLLDAAEASVDFLSPPPEASAGPQLSPGTQVGHWRVGELLGRGGMGEVYVADRIGQDFEQRGALKLLTRLDSEDARHIFARERRILSTLRHPGIAHLLDGGELNGLSWAVIEYVEGLPLDEYARDRPLRTRIELLLKVCEAVSHAHQHLIVHRDLKPANILVTALGEVKLLDFGIAKLLEADASGTVTQVVRASPDYCAPEQLSGDEVSVATDVYALGVVLYELLAGVRPWNHKGQGWAQALRRVAGDEPPPPSHKLEGASRRKLRGDLDSIVLKAMRAAPGQRYTSVDALAEDLKAWLDKRPVKARGGHFLYRSGRVLRRHGWLFATGAAVLIAGVGFLGQTLSFNQQLEVEKDAALSALARADRTRIVLTRIMTEADPWGGGGAQTRLSDALINAEGIVQTELADDAELQAVLYGVLGDVWWGLGERQRSIEARRQELERLSQITPPDPLRNLQAKRKLLRAQANEDQAASVIEGLSALQATLERDFPHELVERALVERELGVMHALYGRPEGHLRHLRASVRLLDTSPPQDLEELAHSLLRLGGAEDAVQNYAAARQVTERGLRILAARHGDDHPLVLRAKSDLAARLSRAGRAAEGIAIYQDILPRFERLLGPLHDELLRIRSNVAYSLMAVDDYDRAIEFLRETLSRQRQKYPEGSLPIGNSLQNLGTALSRLQRYSEALAYLQEAADIFAQNLLPGHVSKALPHLTMARIYGELDQLALLQEHAERAVALLEGDVAEDHPLWLSTRCLLGDVLLRTGQIDEGRRLLLEGINGLQRLSESARHARECKKMLSRAG